MEERLTGRRYYLRSCSCRMPSRGGWAAIGELVSYLLSGSTFARAQCEREPRPRIVYNQYELIKEVGDTEQRYGQSGHEVHHDVACGVVVFGKLQ